VLSSMFRLTLVIFRCLKNCLRKFCVSARKFNVLGTL
jgi:hypothetical protein